MQVFLSCPAGAGNWLSRAADAADHLLHQLPVELVCCLWITHTAVLRLVVAVPAPEDLATARRNEQALPTVVHAPRLTVSSGKRVESRPRPRLRLWLWI